jgi:hypothetical protein
MERNAVREGERAHAARAREDRRAAAPARMGLGLGDELGVIGPTPQRLSLLRPGHLVLPTLLVLAWSSARAGEPG